MGAVTMTAKEYLGQLKTLDCLIKAKELEKERLISLAEKVSVSLSEKVQGGSGGGTENAIIDSVDLEKEITADIKKLVELVEEARGFINKLDNERYKAVLSMRYISDMTFEMIADAMHYSLGTIHNLHARGLKEFDKVFSEKK